ncbi:MAG: nucleotidyltransferase domain-containing protein [Bacteroidota bacterium]
MENRPIPIPNLLNSHLEEIHALCKQHHVARLWAFGSVVTPQFSKDSDVDFLYEWDETAITPESYLDNMWTLLDKLEKLLRHTVDWTNSKRLKNPYFIEEVEETKILLYDQESEKIPV